MLGISVYLSDIDKDYIRYAANLNVKYIFTSLHIPEETIDNGDNRLKELLEICDTLEIKLIPDISPFTFEKLGIKNNDFKSLQAKGFDTVRLDYGFEDVTAVKEISNYFNLVMNASLVDKNYLDKMEKASISKEKIILMHNFYPRKETGLEVAYFEKLNQEHQSFNIQTMAFVVGDEKKRLPLYEGLPTLEKHRNYNPYVAGVEFVKKYNINSIFIGDNKAKRDSLKHLALFMHENIITLPVFLEEQYHYLYDHDIKVRQDISDSIIRLNLKRQSIPIKNNNHRNKGAIVIDNDLAQRYSGEVQIIKKELPFTPRSNNIGWVHPDFLELLNYLDHTVKIKFIKI